MKKRPVFILKSTATGSEILKHTNHRKTTDGIKIDKNKKYDLEKDCNGVRIFLCIGKNRNGVNAFKNKKNKNKDGSLCSGYGAFPDGSKCKGCSDCGYGKQVMTMDEIKRDIRSRAVKVKNGDTLEKIMG